jgi:hypothetical protein
MIRLEFRILALLLVLGLVMLPGQNALAGRGDKSGSSAAPELLIPVGARDVAMGGASVANTFGAEAIFWNPAGLSRLKGSAEAMFSHMSYIADIGVEYAAIAANFEGIGAFGVSLKYLSFGNMEVTTEDNPDGTGQMFSPTYATFGITYSRLLTDRISVGVTANVVSERIDRVSATGVAFNFGVQYSGFANVGGLSIGIAVKNFGSGMQFSGPGLLQQATGTDLLRPPTYYSVEAQTDPLPSVFELGVSYKRQFDERNSLTGAALFENNNYSYDQYNVGLEYSFDNMFFVRGGWQLYPQQALPEYRTFGGTFGAGIHYGLTGIDLTVDYAYRAVQFLGANHVIAIKLGF